MTLETPLGLEAEVGDPEIDYTGQQSRVQWDIMSFLSGVTLKGDLKVTQRGAGANMSVDVAAGSCMIAGGTVTYQGKYPCRSTATVNVAIPAAPGSGTRTDLVVARVYDNQADGLGFYKWQPEVITGTVGAGEPSLPSASYIRLADVNVSAGTASIVNAAITDVRKLNTLGDVPAFQLTGGNGQAIPNVGTGTPYTGWSFSDLIGCDNVGSGEIRVRQDGRYHLTWTQRIDHGGDLTQERAGFIQQTRAGSNYRRIGAQSTYPGASESTQGTAITCSGIARCQTGDTLRAFSYQASGGTLHLNDNFSELTFAGYWVGP